MQNHIEETFGEWTKRPTTWIGVLITLIAGISTASQVATTFGNPIMRWSVLAVLICLCVGGMLWREKRQPSLILDKDASPIMLQSNKHMKVFGFAALGLSIFFCTDLFLNVSGYLTPVEFKGPHFRGIVTSVFAEEEGEKLLSLPIKAVGYVNGDKLSSLPRPLQDGIESDTNRPAISINFEFRKSERTKELVIEDAVLEVVDFRDSPHPITVVSPVMYVDSIVLGFNIEKQTGPLPWKFTPIYVISNGIYSKWEKNMLRVPDNFTSRIKINVASKDPGIFFVEPKIHFLSDFDTQFTWNMVKEKTAIMFVDMLSLSQSKPKHLDRQISISESGEIKKFIYLEASSLVPKSVEK